MQDIGFKAGLEIHQQLDTHKLFCRCPSIVRDEHADILIKRKLRLVAGESGEVDAAAAFENQKEKEFVYEACSTSCCLVELDEEPAAPVNQEALRCALQVAMLFHAKIVDEIQFMRKTVLDGSNVSGFQRTGLVAFDGYIETSKGRVSIPTICLEEESAKKIESTSAFTKYRLDRLGIPLIEIATDPELQDPEHAKEVAEKIGLILRSTGKVKRGIGTIRQDVNLSIRGSNRIEIKGFQDLRSIPKVIQFEIERQSELLKEGKHEHSHVRKVEADFTTTFLRPMPGAARMYPETDALTIPVTHALLESIELPELIEDLAKALEREGLDANLALKVVKEGKAEFYKSLASRLSTLKLSFIVDVFNSVRNQIRKDFALQEDEVTDAHIIHALELLNEGKVAKHILQQVVAEIAKGTFKESKHAAASDDEIGQVVSDLVIKHPGLKEGAYMGLLMKHFGGKVDGKKAMDALRKVLF